MKTIKKNVEMLHCNISTNKTKKAFTLVELVIVITIMSILATIAFVSFSSYIKTSRDSVRVTTAKTLFTGLQITKEKTGKYPIPDKNIVVEVSNQGYVGGEISKIIKLNKEVKDPIYDTRYIYTITKDQKKAQVGIHLEQRDPIFFGNVKIFPQMYAGEINENINENTTNIDYSKLILYTYGERVGVITDKNNTPIQELYNTQVNLGLEDKTFKVQFTNNTDSGILSGSGIDLITQVSIVQNSCVLGSSVIESGKSIQSYQTNTVPYLSTCQSIIRTCTNGVLSGDNNYKYDTCSVQPAGNCNATTYNGYTIPDINHNQTQTVIKDVTGGEEQMQVSCNNGTLNYGNESTTCTTNYVLDNGICKEDLCDGNAPQYSQTNGTQKYNTSWTHNTTSGYCTFVCQAGYYYDNQTNTCKEASVGYYVPTSGQTTQTSCTNNNQYQDQSGQTSCKTVDVGYYSTPEGNIAHINQVQCEANHYCTNGVKTSCPIGTNSPVGSTNENQCQTNLYNVTGNISNGNGASISICGKTTTADTSGNFTINANHGTTCNNLIITRTGYTCTTSTQGPASLTADFTTVAGSCVQNPSCGSANTVATITAPSTNLCSVGTASAVTTNTANYTWMCTNAPATAASCSAPRQYTITFDGNGATSGSMTSQNIQANTSANLTSNGFSKTGFNFLGWNTNKSATTATHTNQASYTIGTANVILYAIWASSCPFGTGNCLTGGYFIISATDSTYTSGCASTNIPAEYDKGKCILLANGRYIAPANTEVRRQHGEFCGNTNCVPGTNYPDMTEGNAAGYCSTLNIAGISNWTLPIQGTISGTDTGLGLMRHYATKLVVYNGDPGTSGTPANAGSLVTLNGASLGGSSKYWSSSLYFWDYMDSYWRVRGLGTGSASYEFWYNPAHRVRCIANQ